MNREVKKAHVQLPGSGVPWSSIKDCISYTTQNKCFSREKKKNVRKKGEGGL